MWNKLLINCKNIFFLILLIFINTTVQSANAQSLLKDEKNPQKYVQLKGPDGNISQLLAEVDADGDGISNQLEVDGYTYNVINGLQPWNGDSNVVYYKTDPLRWSTDGDPYSDYMEVTGINMPSAISSPENHPLVAARPIITVKMNDYDVIPIADITDSKGGDQSSSFTNETSSSHTVSAEVTVEASLNPFELVSVSVTAGYSHTWSSTQSSTSSFGTNWSNTRSSNPSEAARLRLRIYLENEGGATALDVQPTINLKLGRKTIATFIPGQIANILTPPGTVNSRFPQNGTIIIEDDQDDNYLIITLDDLKAIQAGTPLSLEVVQVSANVVRWNPVDEDWNSDIDWAGFESDIDPVSMEIRADLGNNESYRYQVFAGSQYWDPQFTFREIASLIFNVDKTGPQYTIEQRNYPEQWYLSSPSVQIINAWNNAGQPQSMFDVVMSRNTKMVMMSPGSTPQSKINLAIYSGDFSKVVVSAVPNNFPILSVRAEIPLASGMRDITLRQGNNSFFTNDTLLNELPIGPGIVYVTNARGDVSTATIQIPSYYRNAQDVKDYSNFIPNPGGEFWIFPNGNEDMPMSLYCLFYDLQTGTELETPQTFLTINPDLLHNNFSEQSFNNGYGRASFSKLKINPATLKLDLRNISFINIESDNGQSVYLSDYKPGNIYYSYPEVDSISASIDLSGTPFSFDPAVSTPHLPDADLKAVFDNKRQKFTISKKGLLTLGSVCCTHLGIGDDSLQLIYNYEGVVTAQNMIEDNQALVFNQTALDGYVNVGDSSSLILTDNFTLEAWIYPMGPSEGIIFSREGEYEFARFSDGSIRYAIKTGPSVWTWNNTFFNAPENAWTHIALVYDQANVKAFFNGVLFSVIPFSGLIADQHPDANDFRIGNRQLTSGQPFTGVIDEVRVWNIARGEQQIKSTYLSKLSESYYSSADSGLIGYWIFDEIIQLNDSTFMVEDRSINGNHGILVGDVTSSAIPTDIMVKPLKLPEDYALNQNYPNPFNPLTTITYRLKRQADVKLVIYNMLGQQVKTLLSGNQLAGAHSIQWNGLSENGGQAASGTYICAMFVNGQLAKSNKMVLIR
jgi:hypothetical protein